MRMEESQWSPLLQLHNPDQLDDHLNKIKVETGQRFFKKEPMDAPGCSDLAAKRRELLSQRLEARKSIGVGRLRESWTGAHGAARAGGPHLQRNSWPALQSLSRQFGCGCVVGGGLLRRGSSVWPGRDGRGSHFSLEPSVGRSTLGRQERGTAGRCRRRCLPRRLARMSGPSQGLKEVWAPRFLAAGQSGERRRVTSRSSRCSARSRWRRPGVIWRTSRAQPPHRQEKTFLPRWITSPADLWTVFLHASRNLSPAGQGVGYQPKKVEPTGSRALLERLLCRVESSGAAPLAWHHSSGAPLHKNNKARPEGAASGSRAAVHGKAVLQSLAAHGAEARMCGRHPRQLIGCMATFLEGGASRRFSSSSDRSRRGGWSAWV